METTAEDSFILVKFDPNGSANFGLGVNKVTANQMLLAAEYLAIKAKTAMINQEAAILEEQQRNRIIVPEGKLELR